MKCMTESCSGPNGVVFYKADMRLDSKGNITKVSSGDKVELPIATIDPKDIEVDY